MTVDTKIQYSRMGARLLGHVQNGTTDWAADTMEVPSTEYTDHSLVHHHHLLLTRNKLEINLDSSWLMKMET